MFYLNNELLTVEGIIAAFEKYVPLKSAEPKAPTNKKEPTVTLLQRFQKRLQSNYYPNTKSAELNPAVIKNDRRFDAYPELKQALTAIFSSDNKEVIRAQLALIVIPKAVPGDAAAKWGRFNEELGYFEGDGSLPLFTKVASACRAMSALIEDNLADEDMPYIYAYRLMVLFASQAPTPSFDEIAKKTHALLNQANAQQQEKPYHDVILNVIQLPPKSGVSDLEGWLKLIQGTSGIAFLPFFARAPEIEAKMKETKSGELKAPDNINEANEMADRCSYPRASENIELAKLCRAYNIPENGDECSFNKCLDYFKSLPQWPVKTRDNLPNLVITGTATGAAEGYCWVKLPTDDMRALVLGRITACCQSIGGHSEQCVKDAITLSENGLYVLLKRRDKAASNSQPYNNNNNKINDADFEIVGQSYAWISSTGNLTLDSLERSKGRVTISVAEAILTQFADKVLTENPLIKRVTLGDGGGTPGDIQFPPSAIPEKMRMGHQYGDSLRQICIARQPKITDDEFKKMMTKLEISGKPMEILNYLSDYLADTSDFEAQLGQLIQLIKERPELKTKFNDKNLFRLLSLTPAPTLNDLRPVDFESLEKLPEEDRKQALALSQITTAQMMWEDLTPEELLKRLNYISTEERLSVVRAHKDILHLAASNPKSLALLLDMYPKDERLAAIKEKNGRERTVLYRAASNPESLKALFSLLTQAECLAAIKEKNNFGQTVLYRAASNAESLRLLLDMYPEAERLAAIKEKDRSGETVLYYAASDAESLALLLGMYPEAERLAAIKEKNRFGDTVLYDAASNPESLKAVLNALPQASLNELPPGILEMPQVNQFIYEQKEKAVLLQKSLKMQNKLILNEVIPPAEAIPQKNNGSPR